MNVIGHSRGGPLALEASRGISHEIDNLITLDAPAYSSSYPDMNNIGFWMNVTVDQDWVVSLASDLGTSPRDQAGAANVHLNAPNYGHIAAHSAVWKDNKLRTSWWRNWQAQKPCVETWDPSTNTLHGC